MMIFTGSVSLCFGSKGTVYSGYFSLEDERPCIQQWAAEFKEKFGYDPGLIEAIANDCVEIAAKAVEIGGLNRQDTATGLSSIGAGHPAVMGALGENQFDENGDMVRDMLMYVVPVAVFIIDKIEAALLSLGATLEDVVRTRIYLKNMAHWEAVARVSRKALPGNPAGQHTGQCRYRWI